MTRLTPTEARAIEQETLHLNAQAWGVSFGILCAVGIFVATIILVLKGGDHVGAHLSLLSTYLPGYRVTFIGAFIGFVYLFVIGYILGRLIGVVYNFAARR
jgi:hypothetical protein